MDTRASPNILEEIAKELEQIADSIAQEGKALRGAKEETLGCWKSRVAVAFNANVEKSEREIRISTESLRQTAEVINKTVTNLRAISTA